MLWSVLTGITRVFIENPLRQLYFYGPWLNSFGFWSGMALYDICAYLTRTGAALWQAGRNDSECSELVERHFQAFLTGANTALYVATAYFVLTGVAGAGRDYWRLRQLRTIVNMAVTTGQKAIADSHYK